MFKKFLDTLLNIGNSDELSEPAKQRLFYTNSIIIFTLVVLTLVFPFFMMNSSRAGFFTIAFWVVVCFTFVLEKMKLLFAAKIYLFFALNLWILYRCYDLGSAAGTHYLYLTLLAIPFVIFGFESKWKSIVLSLLPAILFMIVERSSFFEVTRLEFPGSHQNLNSTVVKLTVIAFYMVAFYMFDVGQQKYKDVFKQALSGSQTSTLAHELNNVVTSLSLSQRKLKKLTSMPEPNSERIETAFQEIEKITNQLSRILHATLSMSRSQTDTHAPCSINSIVQDALLVCQVKLARKSVEVQIEESSDLESEVLGHEGELLQVLTNLIGNASDAIQSLDTKWIKIGWEKTANSVQIYVTDSGNGIDPKIRKKIFAPLFTTKQRNHGTGLGLWLSKEILKRHGGELYLDESSTNTRFVMKLPAKTELKSLRA